MAEHIGKPIWQTIRDQIPGTRQVDDQSPAAEDPLLKLQISDLRGVAADGIQGSWQRMVPAITVRAELYLGSRLIVSKMFRRGASTFSGPDVCEVTKRIAAQLGKDVAAWLPTAIQTASSPESQSEEQESASSAGGNELLVQVPALYDPDSQIPDPAKTECNVAPRLGRYVFQNVKRRIRDARPIEGSSKSGQGPTLKITITALERVNVGTENFGRSVTIRADLVQNSKLIATHTLKQGSSLSLTDACLNMDRVTRLLGQDVAAWLLPVFHGTRAAMTN
jgi:hypothetical protein